MDNDITRPISPTIKPKMQYPMIKLIKAAPIVPAAQ